MKKRYAVMQEAVKDVQGILCAGMVKNPPNYFMRVRKITVFTDQFMHDLGF